MCGITGYFKYRDVEVNVSLEKMVNSIQHRGPDNIGIFQDPVVGLGHARLSIQDLSDNGNQPMESTNKDSVIIFNGEIYNHLELREELISLGYCFKGNSDTETILYGIKQFGKDFIKRLNGIFALAYYNVFEQKIFITRDRLGVKPLYYQNSSNGYLIFASEIKAILIDNNVQRMGDLQSLQEFLFYGYALENRTLFKNIFQVRPGEIIEISRDGQNLLKSSYFYLPEIEVQENKVITENEAIYQTAILVENAVKRQLLSDVPVGVFLSGGIDSSAITAFASKHYGNKIKTYSAAFDFNDGHNELPLARKVAKHFHTDHSEFLIKGEDIQEIIPLLIKHHDEPFSDAANIPLYLMSKEVKKEVKVVLQGDGGDEMFGGYPRYHILEKYERYYKILKILYPLRKTIPLKVLRNRVDRFGAILNSKREGDLFALLLTMETLEKSPVNILQKKFIEKASNYHPFSHYHILSEKYNFLQSKAQKMLWIDSQIILPKQFLEKVDKSTMANGVEVRVPFLDNDILDFVLSIPTKIKLKGGIKKYLLKESLRGILPDEVLFGPKLGFGVPYANWIKGPLKELLKSAIYDLEIIKSNIFDFDLIDVLINENLSGKKDNGFILWKLMNLCIWIKEYKIKSWN